MEHIHSPEKAHALKKKVTRRETGDRRQLCRISSPVQNIAEQIQPPGICISHLLYNCLAPCLSIQLLVMLDDSVLTGKGETELSYFSVQLAKQGRLQ